MIFLPATAIFPPVLNFIPSGPGETGLPDILEPDAIIVRTRVNFGVLTFNQTKRVKKNRAMKKILMAGVSILTGLQLFAYPTTTTVGKENVEAAICVVNASVEPVAVVNKSVEPVAVVNKSVVPVATVNEKLLKNFKETFPNAQKVIWQETEHLFEVTFLESGILTRITYDKSGEFNDSLRYYTEKYLPYYLINVVKHKYPQQKSLG